MFALNIKSNSNKDLQLSLAIGLMAFVAAAILIMRTSYHGLLFGLDTLDYLSTAENFASGKGLRNYSYHGLIYFPPLYPLLLSLLNVLGMDVIDASRVVNIVALGMIILLTGNWLRLHIKSRLLVAGAVAIIMASHVMNLAVLFAMPVTLFILLTLLALLQLDKFLNRKSSMGVLSLSALFAVLASLTRWAGFSVIFTTLIFIIIDKKTSIKRRVQYTIFYGVITLIPLSIYSAYTGTGVVSTTGTQLGVSEFTLFNYLRSIVESLRGWLHIPELGNIHALSISFIRPESLSPNSVLLLWIVVIMIMLITLISPRKQNTFGSKSHTKAVQYEPQASRRLFFIFITYILIYLLTLYAGLIYLSLLHPDYNPVIRYRYSFPIYIPIIMCIALTLEWFFARKFHSTWPILFKVCVSCLVAFSCVVYISRITQWNISLTAKTLEYNNYQPYLKGYTPNSPIIEYLNNNRLEGDIFVNDVDILYRLTDVMPPVSPIDCSNQFDQFINSIPPQKERVLDPANTTERALDHTYIILLTRDPNYTPCDPQEMALQQYPNLELVVQKSDGSVYELNP